MRMPKGVLIRRIFQWTVIGLALLDLSGAPLAAQSSEQKIAEIHLIDMSRAQRRGDCRTYAREGAFVDAMLAGEMGYSFDNYTRELIRERLARVRANGCTPDPVYAVREEAIRNTAALGAARTEFRGVLAECDADTFNAAQKRYVAALALAIGDAATLGDQELRVRLQSELAGVEPLRPRICTSPAAEASADEPPPASVPATVVDEADRLTPTSEQEYQQADRYEELRYLLDEARRVDEAHAAVAQRCDRDAMTSARARLGSIYGQASTLVSLIAYYQQQNGAIGRRPDFPTPEEVFRAILNHDETARQRQAANCPSEVPPLADGEWDDADLSVFDELETVDQGPTGSYSEMFEMWHVIAGTEGTPAEQLAAAKQAAARCDRAAYNEIVKGMKSLYPELGVAVEEHGPEHFTRDYSLSIVVQGRDDMLAALREAQLLELDCPTIAAAPRPPLPAESAGPVEQIYAVAITDYRVGDPHSTVATPTSEGIGVPDGNGLSFGCGGSAVYRFGDVEFADVPGSDIKLYGLGPGGERVLLELYDSRNHWIRVGVVGEDAGIDIAPYLRAGQSIRFLRLTDATDGCSASQWPGAEIDTVSIAVGAGKGPLVAQALKLREDAESSAIRCYEDEVLQDIAALEDLLEQARRLLREAEQANRSAAAIREARAEVEGVELNLLLAQGYSLENCGTTPLRISRALTQRLEEIVAADSRGWRTNKYVPGSMRNGHVIADGTDPGTFVAQGEYTYNTNHTGWVIVRFTGGQVECLQYHDIGDTCRDPY